MTDVIREPSEELEMLFILTWVVGTLIYEHVRIHQCTHLRFVHLLYVPPQKKVLIVS